MARILHLISQLEEGGAQSQLSGCMNMDGHEVEIASLIASPPDRLLSPFRQAPVPIHSLSYTSDFYAPEILPALDALLSKQKYDLVHCWLFQSIIQGVMACARARIPCIAAPHTVMEAFRFEGKSWERSLIRKTLAKASLVVFPSSTIAVDFVDAGWVRPEISRVVRNAVNVDYFKPEAAGQCVVAVGRLSPEKGYGDFLQIVTRLKQRLPALRFLVAGGGNPPQRQDIEFLGYLSDVREILRQAAVFVNTSYFEGLSVSLLEAQAMGIPVVARNIGGNSEVIVEGWNGFLVGTVGEFTDTIAKLIEDPILRSRISMNARSTVEENFSLREQSKQLAAIYRELL
jgi:glycosyltransferase involved in cell wall biosynthesis